ncbi:MAG: sirohydrochlorin chelatase [Candidatus Competibacterales bacterium]
MTSPEVLCLLVDNGSKRAEATLELRQLAAALAERVRRPVRPVSLLHADAVAAEALGGAPAEVLRTAIPHYYHQGWRHFLVLPLFFGPSGALTWYLPEKTAEFKTEYPDLQVHQAPPLVDVASHDDNGLLAILADHILATAQGCAAPPAVVLVDHGSPVPEVTAVRDFLARELHGQLAGQVQKVVAASMERREGEQYAFNEPLLEGVFDLHGLAGEVVVAMQFLLPGRHAGVLGDVEQIVAAALEGRDDIAIHYTPLVGRHPGLIDSLARRCAQGLEAVEALDAMA